MDSQDGEIFVKQLAAFVRTHENALANALQNQRRNVPRHGASKSVSSLSTLGRDQPSPTQRPNTATSTRTNGLASALSMASLNLSAATIPSARLELTPHHLFYLLTRFEELGITVGPMKIRLENLHDTSTSANYVSFLSQSQRTKSQASDVGSIRSVSSIKSVMSGMSALWASFGISSGVSTAKLERQKAAVEADVKQLYSAFTKIPCLRLAPDFRARLIKGYEEFPFDSAVPLRVFKNVQSLEISDIDFRQFYGWHHIADQLKSLTLRRASLEDPADVLIDIILDDMDKRRRRTSKARPTQTSPIVPWLGSSSPRRSVTFAPGPRTTTYTPAYGTPDNKSSLTQDAAGTPSHEQNMSVMTARSDMPPPVPPKSSQSRSHSPSRPSLSRNASSHRRAAKIQRSGSGSSHSSLSDAAPSRRGSLANMLEYNLPPASKWRFLRHLGLPDNSLTHLAVSSLLPLTDTLHSIDLSSNLFAQVPDSLASLTALRALNLANCMIDNLRTLTRTPLPAITAINLRANRLQSIAGVERLYSLERIDLRDNRMTDPVELARLTGIPDLREIWVEGNPLTKTHRDYRVTVFNLFRKTPGYTEDIIIDGTGPSYAERKLLVERTGENVAVPVVKPTLPELSAINVSKPAIIYDETLADSMSPTARERRLSRAAVSETNVNASRRRRAPRRRIVDLAESSPVSKKAEEPSQDIIASPVENNYRLSQTAEVHQSTRPAKEIDVRPSSIRMVTEPPPTAPRTDIEVLPPVRTGSEPPPFDGLSTAWKLTPSWSANSDSFRQQLESLKVSTAADNYFGVTAGGDHSSTALLTESPFFPAVTPLGIHTASPPPLQAIHSGRSGI